jgi:hypothetical protein
VQHVGGDRRVHEPDLGAGPRGHEVGVLARSAHHHERQPEGLAQHDGAHGDGRLLERLQQEHPPPDGVVVLDVGPDEQAGGVLEEHERQPVGVAEADELGRLEAGVGRDGAGGADRL